MKRALVATVCCEFFGSNSEGLWTFVEAIEGCAGMHWPNIQKLLSSKGSSLGVS